MATVTHDLLWRHRGGGDVRAVAGVWVSRAHGRTVTGMRVGMGCVLAAGGAGSTPVGVRGLIHRMAHVVGDRSPLAVVPALVDPPDELSHRGPVRVVRDVRGLRHGAGLHTQHAGAAREHLPHDRLGRRPVQSADLYDSCLDSHDLPTSRFVLLAPYRTGSRLAGARTSPARVLAAHQPGDRVRCLSQLLLALVRVPPDVSGEAVLQVLLEQAESDALQLARCGGDLGQHVDAVLLLIDHPGDAPDLALDAAEPVQVVDLVGAVAGHGPYSLASAHGDVDIALSYPPRVSIDGPPLRRDLASVR